MPTFEECPRRPREERLARIARTPEELASAVRSVDAAVLTHRPAPKSWAPTEVVCHLRDNEEWFLERMRLIMVMDLPRFVATNPDHWADERLYQQRARAAKVEPNESRTPRAEQRPVVQRDAPPLEEEPERVAAGVAGVPAVEPSEIGRLGREDRYARQAAPHIAGHEVAVG